MSESITISKDVYLDLLNAQRKLDILEASGVDNWEWYGDAMVEFEELTYGDLENAS